MDLESVDYPIVWDGIVGFLIIDPSGKNAFMFVLSILHDELVDHKLIDCTKSVARISFLFDGDNVVCLYMMEHSRCYDAGEDFVHDREAGYRSVVRWVSGFFGTRVVRPVVSQCGHISGFLTISFMI